jgi:hypothetical protein
MSLATTMRFVRARVIVTFSRFPDGTWLTLAPTVPAPYREGVETAYREPLAEPPDGVRSP